jgi:hypothetical protein
LIFNYNLIFHEDQTGINMNDLVDAINQTKENMEKKVNQRTADFIINDFLKNLKNINKLNIILKNVSLKLKSEKKSNSTDSTNGKQVKQKCEEENYNNKIDNSGKSDVYEKDNEVDNGIKNKKIIKL